MAKKFTASLTDVQYDLARRFEAHGITTFSQAVKILVRKDYAQIEEWKQQLRAKKGLNS